MKYRLTHFFQNALRRPQRPVQRREPRMYVLVRSDLPAGLQAAQACHAASYLSASNPLALYQHPTTIVLAVNGEDELLLEMGRYQRKPWDPEGRLFREPDLGGAATAFACYTDGYEYDHLPLALKENNVN